MTTDTSTQKSAPDDSASINSTLGQIRSESSDLKDQAGSILRTPTTIHRATVSGAVSRKLPVIQFLVLESYMTLGYLADGDRNCTHWERWDEVWDCSLEELRHRFRGVQTRMLCWVRKPGLQVFTRQSGCLSRALLS